MRKIYLIIITVALAVPNKIIAQQEESILPQIGKPMPDFELNKVYYFSKDRINQNDLKGKWTFLDFWFAGCTSCISSFPKINKINEKFGKKINYLLVGLNDKANKGIEDVYEKLRIKHHLTLPVAYDSMLYKKWKLYSFPHIFVIDPKGVLRAVTNGLDLNVDKMQQLLIGGNPSFYDKTITRKKFDDFSDKSLDTNLLYRSLLYKWTNTILGTYAPIDVFLKLNNSTVPIKGYYIGGAPLSELYFIAYFGYVPSFLSITRDSLYGNVFPFPVLYLKDTSLFKCDDMSKANAKGYYNYSLIVQPKKATKEYLMQIMQNDLRNNFGYKVTIEKRKMSVWKLISKSGAQDLLKTRSSQEYASDTVMGAGSTGFELRNQPIKHLLFRIAYYLNYNQPPFFDETGIKDNVDIIIEANMFNFNEVRASLQKNKLDLIKEEKEMSVLIISDP